MTPLVIVVLHILRTCDITLRSYCPLVLRIHISKYILLRKMIKKDSMPPFSIFLLHYLSWLDRWIINKSLVFLFKCAKHDKYSWAHIIWQNSLFGLIQENLSLELPTEVIAIHLPLNISHLFPIKKLYHWTNHLFSTLADSQMYVLHHLASALRWQIFRMAALLQLMEILWMSCPLF